MDPAQDFIKLLNTNESVVAILLSLLCLLQNLTSRFTYLDTGLDVDGSDLLDNLRGGVQVDHSLVDPIQIILQDLAEDFHGALFNNGPFKY
jgi:hypothetical protein